jgi:hypothetical protein
LRRPVVARRAKLEASLSALLLGYARFSKIICSTRFVVFGIFIALLLPGAAI